MLVALWCCLAAVAAAAFQPADEPSSDPAARQYAAAVALQNRELYELAADEWTKFLTQYPDDPRASRARHYRGVCQLKDERFEQAIADFEQVAKGDPKFPLLEATYLNLGLARYSLARSGRVEFYAPAAEAFAALAAKFPKSEYLPQATFYRGEALYAAGKKEAAIAEYARFVTAYPKHALAADALYALGVAQEELALTAPAEATYQKFLAQFAQHRFAPEVQMRQGELLMAQGKYAEAQRQFAAAAAAVDFALADAALMRQAAAEYEQQQYAAAAASYRRLAQEFPQSKQRTPALLAAGQCLFLAGEFRAARDTLESIDPKTPAGLEAAHWIAQSWLKQRRPTDALDVAEEALALAAGRPERVPLELDRAEALAQIPQQREAALEAYAALAAEHPQHALAPQARYLAAFTAQTLGRFADAGQHARDFQQSYPQHELSADVLAVEAESLLQLGRHADAQRRYVDLLERYAQHPDAINWRLRLAWAGYLQQQFRETIDQLRPQLASLPAGAIEAEAQFLIGSSALELKDDQLARQAFAAAWNADPNWRQADEVLLGWAQADRQANAFDDARDRLELLLEKFPKSRLLDRAYFRLGELSYAQGDFAGAAAAYRRVIAGWLDSPVLAASRVGLGFSELGQANPEAAAQAFTQLIEGNPRHELAARARYGRALALHQLRQYAEAGRDLEAVVHAGKTPERADAQYLLGLCQAAQSQHAEAAVTWRELLQEQPDYGQADKVRYELAWSLKAQAKEDEAAAAFAELVKAHPQSALAAESWYHVGEAAYAQSDWPAAAKAYQQALDAAQAGAGANAAASPLGEQATHKLAWSWYKQGELDRAAESFAAQGNQWPQGMLAQDARFMQAEILFKQEKFAEALPLYREVKQPSNPEFLALARLHAGQAAAKLNQWEESLKLLAQGLEQAPDSAYVPEALYEQGWAEQNLGQFDKALASYEAVTAKTDREVAARARFMIGEIHFDQQDHKEAVRHFFKVAYSYGYPQWQAAAHYEAGRCFEVLGKLDQAQKSYEELIKQFPDTPRAAAAKERLAALGGGK